MEVPMIEFKATIDELITKAVKESCEITITVSPDNVEIRVSPWKPFSYNCPYKGAEANANQ
jgi:hypothetical protein